MITVHHLEHSRSHRILWLLEELGVPYEIRRYHRDPMSMLAPNDLRDIHPLGKAPVITDGSCVIAESGAIIEYLIETYAGAWLVPALPDNRLAYRYWLHYAEGSAMPLLSMKLLFQRLPGQVPFPIRPFARLISRGVENRLIDPQLTRHLSLWEDALQHTGWFAGADFSAADIQMSFPVEASLKRIHGADKSERLRSYLDRLRDRPAYQRALEAGGRPTL